MHISMRSMDSMVEYGQYAQYGQYGQYPQRSFSSQAYPMNDMPLSTSLPYRGTTEEIQYAIDALFKDSKSKNRKIDSGRSAPTPQQPTKAEVRQQKKQTESRAAPDGQVKQKEYASLHRTVLCDPVSARINKPCRTSKASKPKVPEQGKGRRSEPKIMLPAPQPTPEYLSQAAQEPHITDTPGRILVILDLNGTVLYRPNRNAKTRIERPFLKPFLQFLFQNFSVMVWSSAKPDNVQSLVAQSLDKNLQAQLVARWGRDSFGLSPANYNRNVQVYKNLKLVWEQGCDPTTSPGVRGWPALRSTQHRSHR